ncbi:MAG TPA: helix-turn-helix transcriptional regulator [Gemmatirosa sp.]
MAARRALGAVLRRLREAHPDAPSQERVGEWADLHRNYVGSAERGERNVAFEALTRWLAALGVTWAEFGAAVDLALATAASIPAPQS